MKNINYFFIFLIGISLQSAFSQESCRSHLAKAMESIRQTHNPASATVSQSFKLAFEANNDSVFYYLSNYQKDKDIEVKRTAYTIAMNYALQKGNEASMHIAVEQALEGLLELDFLTMDNAYRGLRLIDERFFSEKAKKDLILYLTSTKVRRNNHYLLAGAAGLDSLLPHLKQVTQTGLGVSSGKWYGTSAWYAYLASAKLGDAEAALFCIKMYEECQDEIEKYNVLLPQLIYTFHPKVVEALSKELFLDKRKASSEVWLKGAFVRDELIILLQRSTDNFPTSAKANYNAEEIQAVANWLKNKQYVVVP
ncbi:MAG: hypothetical protein ACRCYT_00590, partial [Cetobacterium sp.]